MKHRIIVRRRAFYGMGQSGSVAVMFGVSVFMLLTIVGVSINMAALAAERAALQRAVDNAALSGAASYALDTAAFNALAITTATTAFCDATTNLPMGATVTAQTGGQTCGTAAGPLVTAVTDSYVTGTPGITHGSGISCTGTYLPAAPYNCGFIVTVSAELTMKLTIPFVFGKSTAVSATGMAVNPFISFAKIFSLPSGVASGAKYANSVWAYPLALNAAGSPDYSSNAGALPDTSACYGGPDTVVCGKFVMLASTMYQGKTGYTPPGQTVIYDAGVVRSPASPTGITATTPLGIAFESIAGGNYVQYPTTPGVYGYEMKSLGATPAKYLYAQNGNGNGCIYPYSNLVYNTVGQVWTTSGATNGLPSAPYAPLLPWSKVTHWFYSSYLGNNLPPSNGEIVAQTPNNEDIPSVPTDPAQAGGNILGTSTYIAVPSPAVPTSVAACPATTTKMGVTTSNDLLETTTYIVTGNDNCSLYITQSTTAGAQTPSAAYTGSCFNPASTPGRSYANLSCAGYGSNVYTFFWNDMGGAASDNENYGDGIVQISCASAAHVALIN